MIKKLKDNFINWCKNIWFAGTFAWIILLLIFWLFNETWKFIFAVLIAYLVADLIRIIFLKGGKGIIQFPFSGNTEAKPRGHGYLVFLTFIVISTIGGSLVATFFVSIISKVNVLWYTIFTNFSIILLVYLNFYATFYS